MDQYVIKKAEQIKIKYGTDNPFQIMSDIGVHVKYNAGFKHLKAFYYVMLGVPYVVINSSLNEVQMKTVAAHELGHHILHKQLAIKSPLKEMGFYDMTSGPEYEANLFASELLIDDLELAMLMNEESDYYKICSIMHVSDELMAFKINSLNKMGGAYRIPFVFQSDFLANSHPFE